MSNNKKNSKSKKKKTNKNSKSTTPKKLETKVTEKETTNKKETKSNKSTKNNKTKKNTKSTKNTKTNKNDLINDISDNIANDLPEDDEDLVIIDGIVIENDDLDEEEQPKEKKNKDKDKEKENKKSKKENNKDNNDNQDDDNLVIVDGMVIEDNDENETTSNTHLSWFERKKIEYKKQKEEKLQEELKEIKETKSITGNKIIKKVISFIKTVLKLIIISIIITTIILFIIVRYLRTEATDNRFGFKEGFITEKFSTPLSQRYLYEPNNINYYVLRKSASTERNAKQLLLDYLIDNKFILEEEADKFDIKLRHETEYGYMYLYKVKAIPNDKCHAFFIWKTNGFDIQKKTINYDTLNNDKEELRELLDLYLFLKDGKSSRKYIYSKLTETSNNVFSYKVYYTDITHDNGGINLIHLARDKYTLNINSNNTLVLDDFTLDESKDLLIIDEE